MLGRQPHRMEEMERTFSETAGWWIHCPLVCAQKLSSRFPEAYRPKPQEVHPSQGRRMTALGTHEGSMKLRGLLNPLPPTH